MKGSLISAAIALSIITSEASAQGGACLSVDCDPTGSLVQSINNLFEANLLLNDEIYMQSTFNLGEEEHYECISQCKAEANSRRKDCSDVYLSEREVVGYQLCLRAVEDWHGHCLDYDLLNCN